MEKEPLEVVRLKSLEDLTGGRIADTSSVPTKASQGRQWNSMNIIAGFVFYDKFNKKLGTCLEMIEIEKFLLI